MSLGCQDKPMALFWLHGCRQNPRLICLTTCRDVCFAIPFSPSAAFGLWEMPTKKPSARTFKRYFHSEINSRLDSIIPKMSAHKSRLSFKPKGDIAHFQRYMVLLFIWLEISLKRRIYIPELLVIKQRKEYDLAGDFKEKRRRFCWRKYSPRL